MTTEQLKELEELSYNLVEIKLIAVILDVPEIKLREALSIPQTEAYKAFYRGYGKQILEQRKAILKAAGNGSNPAQEAVAKFIQRFAADLPDDV